MHTHTHSHTLIRYFALNKSLRMKFYSYEGKLDFSLETDDVSKMTAVSHVPPTYTSSITRLMMVMVIIIIHVCEEPFQQRAGALGAAQRNPLGREKRLMRLETCELSVYAPLSSCLLPA